MNTRCTQTVIEPVSKFVGGEKFGVSTRPFSPALPTAYPPPPFTALPHRLSLSDPCLSLTFHRLSQVSVLDGPETKTEDSTPVITVWSVLAQPKR